MREHVGINGFGIGVAPGDYLHGALLASLRTMRMRTCRLWAAFQEDEHVVLVLEYADAGDLHGILRKHHGGWVPGLNSVLGVYMAVVFVLQSPAFRTVVQPAYRRFHFHIATGA